jgi:hypothetical protein
LAESGYDCRWRILSAAEKGNIRGSRANLGIVQTSIYG